MRTRCFAFKLPLTGRVSRFLEFNLTDTKHFETKSKLKFSIFLFLCVCRMSWNRKDFKPVLWIWNCRTYLLEVLKCYGFWFVMVQRLLYTSYNICFLTYLIIKVYFKELNYTRNLDVLLLFLLKEFPGPYISAQKTQSLGKVN